MQSAAQLPEAFVVLGFAFYVQPMMMPLLHDMPPGPHGLHITSQAVKIVIIGMFSHAARPCLGINDGCQPSYHFAVFLRKNEAVCTISTHFLYLFMKRHSARLDQANHVLGKESQTKRQTAVGHFGKC